MYISRWAEHHFMVCVLLLTEYEWMKTTRGQDKETEEGLEERLDA